MHCYIRTLHSQLCLRSHRCCPVQLCLLHFWDTGIISCNLGPSCLHLSTYAYLVARAGGAIRGVGLGRRHSEHAAGGGSEAVGRGRGPVAVLHVEGEIMIRLLLLRPLLQRCRDRSVSLLLGALGLHRGWLVSRPCCDKRCCGHTIGVYLACTWPAHGAES